MKQQNSHQAAPHERFDRTLERAGCGEADKEWQPEGRSDPERIQAVDHPNRAVREQIACEAIVVRTTFGREEPANVSVPEPAESAAEAWPPANMWRVRVTLFVRIRVMFPVLGHPSDDRPLEGEASKNRPQNSKRACRFEAAMSEEPVEPYRDAETCQRVEDTKHYDVDRLNRDPPQLRDRGSERNRGYRHAEEGRKKSGAAACDARYGNAS